MENIKSFKDRVYSFVQPKMDNKELIEFFDMFDFKLKEIIDKEKSISYSKGYEAATVHNFGEYETKYF